MIDVEEHEQKRKKKKRKKERKEKKRKKSVRGRIRTCVVVVYINIYITHDHYFRCFVVIGFFRKAIIIMSRVYKSVDMFTTVMQCCTLLASYILHW